ncbi:3' exoribonuclease family, variant [Loa loa]|uniref:polyribonucleotide nucleotidyltransferase n=1 Tax=Loa loa TaxID=7209 RepID=A0A1S0UDF8_LOALO|nr:3' exoribonuclease family, variant [Loa loa]EJD73692.1 3' exoribonuclease family, variant [Loa loa]
MVQVLATVVGRHSSTSDTADFMPLTVDFQQSASAVGRIPTNYLRRELQRNDADILASRMIDRSIRPLFPKDYSGETQIICKPLAVDDDGDPVMLGLNAASAALTLSDIPWEGPLGAVRIALINNEIVVNPSRKNMKISSLDLVIAACDDGNRILMIDMDGCETGIEKFAACIETGLQAISYLIQAINKVRDSCGRQKRQNICGEIDIDMIALMEEMQILYGDQLYHILTDIEHDKLSRDRAVSALGNHMLESLKERSTPHKLRHTFTNLLKKSLREALFKSERRCDGRKFDELRPVDIKMDVHKKLHGSALFQRGQTQVFSTVTFDAPSAAFQPDALSQLLEDFPYCLRLACDVLESNGSSSMASVCAGCLALLDAGVQMKTPAAGVAMGLIIDKERNDYRILTDINGLEDFAGDMDFKIAGTVRGYTAMQLDLKVPGIKPEVMMESLEQARNGLEHLLQLMRKAQPFCRNHFKSTVPVHETIPVEIYKRHIIFRSGGYNAKLIESETGAKISVEDDANISIFAPNKVKLEEAKMMLTKMFESESEIELVFGAMYKGEITDVLEHGVLVTLHKSMKPILLKNSNLDVRNVAHPKVLGFKVGQKIIIQYLGRDPNTGPYQQVEQALFQSALLQDPTVTNPYWRAHTVLRSHDHFWNITLREERICGPSSSSSISSKTVSSERQHPMRALCKLCMVQEEETTKESYPTGVPTVHILQRLSVALSSFTPPHEMVLERTSKGFSKSPVQEIDEYFELVAKLGRPLFKWEIIRCAFLWKLEQTMSEMLCIEAESAVTEDDKKMLISDDNLRQQRQFILQKAAEFDGTPFTFQRLCELLISPSRHYKRTDKYLRALEKNINVVTTITESGERVTGVEPFPGELDISSTLRIEEPFFVQVDECDAPVETKLIAAGDYFSRVLD